MRVLIDEWQWKQAVCPATKCPTAACPELRSPGLRFARTALHRELLMVLFVKARPPDKSNAFVSSSKATTSGHCTSVVVERSLSQVQGNGEAKQVHQLEGTCLRP
jgi:hypothetical protein